MNTDILDKIEKLSNLKEQNILTEEEFILNKKILLDNLNTCNSINGQKYKEETYWLSIPSMILGIFVMLACFDESYWDKDALIGASLFIVISMTLGLINLSTQERGKGMAIAGITLSILSSLIIIGSQSAS